MSHPTDAAQFLQDLDGGVFAEKISRILSDVAAGVMDNGRAGSVTISFDMKRFENTYQVVVAHKVSYKKPTLHGDISENNRTSTPMHVNTGGEMTLFPKSQVPEGQQHLADTKTGELVEGGEK